MYSAITVMRFAMVVMLSINRYTPTGKTNAMLSFPVVAFDLCSLLGLGQPARQFVYDLVGVVIHEGASLVGGEGVKLWSCYATKPERVFVFFCLHRSIHCHREIH